MRNKSIFCIFPLAIFIALIPSLGRAGDIIADTEGSAEYYYLKGKAIDTHWPDREPKGSDLEAEREKRSEQARLYEKAIEIDPGYIPAYLGLFLNVSGSETIFYQCTAAELGDDSGINFLITFDEFIKAVDSLPEAQHAYMNDPKSAAQGSVSMEYKMLRICQTLKPEIYSFLAEKYLNANKYSDSLKYANLGISLAPDNAKLYATRSNAYYFENKINESIVDARKACELTECFMIQFLRSKGLLTDQKATEAKIHFDNGNRLSEEGNFTAAIEEFTKAIDTDLGYRDAFYNRGLAYMEIDDSEKAKHDFYDSFTIDPYFKDGYYMRATVLLNQKKYSRARSQMDFLLSNNGDDAHAYNIRASIYYLEAEFQKAVDDASLAIKLDPTNSAFYDTRGNAYYALENFPDASKDAIKACELGNCSLLDMMKAQGNLAPLKIVGKTKTLILVWLFVALALGAVF